LKKPAIRREDPSALPRYPTRLLALALLLTAASTAWLAWIVFDSNRFVEELQRRHLRSVHLQGVIVHLDEVLTMSARMAAATGDRRWEERYRRHEPELDAAIKEAARLAPQPQLAGVTAQIEAANLALVEMEDRAFALVHEGRLEQARGVLFGPAYEAQKQVYAVGIARLIEQLSAQLNARIRARAAGVWVSALSTGVVMAALLITWFTALRTLARWREAFRHLYDGQELRVRERTGELHAATLEAQAGASRLRAITGAAHDAIVMIDPAGRISHWNPAAERIFGYASAEAIGRDLHDLIAPARFHPAHRAAFPVFRHTGTGAALGKTLDLEAVRKDGTQISVQLSLSAVQAEDGWHAVGIVRDVTEHKKAEEELQFANVLLSSQQEASPDGILVVDEATRILTYNRRFVEMWGLPDELVQGKVDEPVLRFITSRMQDPESFRRRVHEIYEDRRETGRDELLLADGRVFDRYTTSMFGPEERYYGRVWFFRDVTGQKHAEEALRQLSRAVEQSPASIVITDPAGSIVYVNPKFVEVTGYTQGEALGQNPRILKSGDKGPEAYRELWQTIASGKVWHGEFHNRRKSGELYWESASISPILDPAGRITHYLAVKEDITARKLSEAERDQLVRNLQDALARVKALSGLLPICAGCKKIRDSEGSWSQVESYVQQHSEATFTHGMCPDCTKKFFPGVSLPSPKDKEDPGR